jgi:hypothetical protein
MRAKGAAGGPSGSTVLALSVRHARVACDARVAMMATPGFREARNAQRNAGLDVGSRDGTKHNEESLCV